MIHENGDRLDTGFLSIPFLLDVLTEEGESELAYQLLFQEEGPSWLYEVKMGATTIWEAWQAMLPDGTPTSVTTTMRLAVSADVTILGDLITALVLFCMSPVPLEA